MVINIKARLPLFLFISTLFFLAFAVSVTLGQDDTEQQCREKCKDFKRPALFSMCVNQCKFTGMGPWKFPPAADEKLPYSESPDQQCRQQCQMHQGGPQQQQCQRQCMKQQQMEQCRDQCQQTIESPETCQRICQHQSDSRKAWDSKIVYFHHEQQQQGQMKQQEREQMKQLCRQQCEVQGIGGQQQQGQQCERQCEQKIQQQERQFEQCQQRCQQHGQGQQQQQCQRSCRQQLEDQQQREQQQQQGQGQQGQKIQEQEREQLQQMCQQRCEMQGSGGRQQQQQQQKQHCQRQCEQQVEQQIRQLEQCQQRCQQHGQGQQQQECQRTCRREIEQQQQKGQQQEGQGGNEVEDDALNGSGYGGAKQRFEQCKQRCQQQQQGQQCPSLCKQQFEQEKQQFKQCKQSCESMGGAQRQQCKQQCQQQGQQQQQGGSGGNEVEDDAVNGYDVAKEHFQQCKQSCQSQQQHGQQGQGGQEQCQRECKQQFEQEKQQFKQCKRSCEKQAQDDDEKQQCKQQCGQQGQQQPRGGGGNEEDDEVNGQSRQRFEQCKQSCQRHQQGQGEQEDCSRQCQEQFEQEKQQYQQCKQSCQRQSQGDQQQCKQQCKQQREQQRGSSGRGGQNPQGQSQSQRNNPYYFPSNMFQPRFQSNEGGLFVLERFTKRQSELLRGIKNYRLAIFEAQPNTFVLPHHCDAEAIFVVLNGRCTCTLLMQDQKESFNMEYGDVVRIPAGATIYLINQDNEEKLQLAKLIQPVNSPGRFEEFFPAGSGNPESYFNVFSNDILEAAFNTPRKHLEQGLKQQRGQGMVMRAPREQLQALSQHSSSSRRRGSRQSQGPFNLKQQRPVHSNNYGQLFEARPEEFSQLQDMDVSVKCLEINQQSMMLPHYNSKATYLLMVVEGNGRVEMACPHMASQSQEMRGSYEQGEQGGKYMKVTAQLSPGDAFVVPAGHPVAFVAQNNNSGKRNQNLKILGFGLNAQNNMRNLLAGQEDNVMQQMDREARQLAFGQEMEQIFTKQQESYFVPIQQGRSRNNPLSSILEFAGVI